MFWQQLFARKSIDKLNEEMKGDNRLRRILGPISLTALGVGAIIGAGIFVMTGRAAAVEAGPGIMASYMVAGLGCLFAALCYCEFAAMAPVAGSAYTYAYATLGELMAWIIGWDLILEYAMACAVVASAWSKYFNEFLRVCGLWTVPDFLMHDPFSTMGHSWFNLPAALIVLLVTGVLVIGIRESATTNAVLVGVKVGVVIFVILVGFGFGFVSVTNWTEVPVSDRFTPEESLIPDKAREIVSDGGKNTGPEVDREAVILTQEGFATERIRRAEREGQEILADVVHKYAERYRRQNRLASLDETDADRKTQTADLKAGFAAALRTVVAPRVAQLKREGQFTDEQAAQTIDQAVTNYTVPMVKHNKMTDSEAETVERETLAAFRTASVTPPPDNARVAELLEQVDKAAPVKTTSKWGILGLLGLNESLKSIDDSVRSPFFPYGISGVMLGAAIVFFAYIGFDSISTHSEEAVRPQRDVPLGILASLAICTVLYIGVAAVITGMERYSDINQDAAIAAAFRNKSEDAQAGSWSAWLLRGSAGLIATGALAGMTSVLLITFLSQARIFLAMARDKLLPPGIFGVVHPKFKTPHISTMLTGGTIAVVAALTPIHVLEEMVSIGTLMAFVVVCASVLLLRVRQPNLQRPFRTPFIWFVAPAGILVNLAMTLFLPIETWLRLLIWLGLGLLIYFCYGMWRSDVRREMQAGKA